MKVAGVEVFEYFMQELGNEDVSHHGDSVIHEKDWQTKGFRRRLRTTSGVRSKEVITPESLFAIF